MKPLRAMILNSGGAAPRPPRSPRGRGDFAALHHPLPKRIAPPSAVKDYSAHFVRLRSSLTAFGVRLQLQKNVSVTNSAPIRRCAT